MDAPGTPKPQRFIVRHLDERDFAPLLLCGGRDLGADPAGADGHEPSPGLDALADRLGIGGRPQVQDPIEVGAGHR